MNNNVTNSNRNTGVSNRSLSVAVVADTTDLLLSKDSPWNRILKQLDMLRTNLQVLISPGDRQFKDVPKRVRLMVVSMGVPLLFAFSKVWLLPQSESIYLWAVVAVALAAVTYIGLIWGLGQFAKTRLSPFCCCPCLCSQMCCFWVYFCRRAQSLFWDFGIAVATLLYTPLMLISNDVVYTIPLSRLGRRSRIFLV
jgi:hypothetical protein